MPKITEEDLWKVFSDFIIVDPPRAQHKLRNPDQTSEIIAIAAMLGIPESECFSSLENGYGKNKLRTWHMAEYYNDTYGTD